MQSGYTALTLAACKQNWDIVRLLVARGADPSIKDEVKLIMACVTPKFNPNPIANPNPSLALTLTHPLVGAHPLCI